MANKSLSEQMNDLVAQIVKEDGDRAALGIFASAIALATLPDSGSTLAVRVGELADEWDAEDEDDEDADADEDDEDTLEEGVTPEDYRRDQAADGLINEEGFDAHGNPIAE